MFWTLANGTKITLFAPIKNIINYLKNFNFLLDKYIIIVYNYTCKRYFYTNLEKRLKTMYQFYVTMKTDNGRKTTKVKASSKQDAIKKASTKLKSNTIIDVVMLKSF